MIDITFLYCGKETGSVPHRYGKALKELEVPENQRHEVAAAAHERRPIVVWNFTRTCNLACVHCYSNSEAKAYPGELTTDEGKALISDFADYKIPALLFSGGEPLTRPDLFELATFARNKGLHVVLSTNGTLINEETAKRIREADFSYVGISLDGLNEVNDHFRGKEGAFERALRGIKNCKAVKQKVGLRLTLTRHTYQELQRIFDLIEEQGIDRVCFYHLVPSGRGSSVVDLKPDESREAMDIILSRTKDAAKRGVKLEVLTVDNHCDGPYMVLKLKEENDPRAEKVHALLKWNGGGTYSSGVGIACVDFVGNVHPDQFWMHYTLGNVRERKFSEIWQDVTNPLMAGLKNRKPLLKGRCAQCKFIDLCGGALRVRAEITTGDPWASDPGCYLTDEEIGVTPVSAA